jgi:hypothetical protein
MLVYDCIDEGRIKGLFRHDDQEITPDEVVLMSARERDPKDGKGNGATQERLCLCDDRRRKSRQCSSEPWDQDRLRRAP